MVKRICLKPWRELDVHFGHASKRLNPFPCCPGWTAPEFVLWEPVGEDIWTGSKMQAMRDSVLSGEFKWCGSAERCPHIAAGSLSPVDRLSKQEKYLLSEENIRQGPRILIVSFDRNCNLSCPSCRTGIVRESYEALYEELRYKTTTWKNLEEICMSGAGDPFASPELLEWLRTFKKSEVPSLKRVSILTNGVLLNERMWASMSEDIRTLTEVKLTVSVDATNAYSYSKVRRGGDFYKLINNLWFFSYLRREGRISFFRINIIIQRDNYKDLPDFLDLGKRLGCDQISLRHIEDWGLGDERGYLDKAVHLPGNPLHEDYRRVVKRCDLSNPCIVYQFKGMLESLL